MMTTLLHYPFPFDLSGFLGNAPFSSFFATRSLFENPKKKNNRNDQASDSDDDEKNNTTKKRKNNKRGSGKHKCNYSGCNDSFQSKFSLRRHMKTHTGDRPFICTWQDPYQAGSIPCGKRFAENSTLKRHIQTHTGEKPYSCPYHTCRKLFADNVNLKRHLRLVHDDTGVGVVGVGTQPAVGVPELLRPNNPKKKK